MTLAGGAVAEKIDRNRQESTAKAGAPGFVLDEEHSETFFEFVFAMGTRVVNVGDDAIEYLAGAKITHFEFEITEFDRNNFRTGFGRRLATKAVVSLGAKTLQEAQETVDSLALIGMFGLFFSQLGTHAIRDWAPVSRTIAVKRREKLRRLKEEREAKAKEPSGNGRSPSPAGDGKDPII